MTAHRVVMTALACLLLSACQTVSPGARFTTTQQEELRSQGFVETEAGWELSMADRLLFDTDSAAIRPDMQVTLDRIAAGLQRVGITAARVEGHTDSTGTAAYNRQLSHARAAVIGEALVARGFDRSRVIERGWGESRPIADNGNENGRLLNRRVVIIVSPE